MLVLHIPLSLVPIVLILSEPQVDRNLKMPQIHGHSGLESGRFPAVTKCTVSSIFTDMSKLGEKCLC